MSNRNQKQTSDARNVLPNIKILVKSRILSQSVRQASDDIDKVVNGLHLRKTPSPLQPCLSVTDWEIHGRSAVLFYRAALTKTLILKKGGNSNK